MSNRNILCSDVDGNTVTFAEPHNMVKIGDYRSHYPVFMFSDGTVDHDDFFYQFVDAYTGMTLGRYERHGSREWEEYKQRVVGVCLLSFDDWISPEHPDFQKPPFSSFEQYLARFLYRGLKKGDISVTNLAVQIDCLVCMLAGTPVLQDASAQQDLEILAHISLKGLRLLLASNFDNDFTMTDVFEEGVTGSEMIAARSFAKTAHTAKARAKLFPEETRLINAARFSMVRKRATDICIAMRDLDIDALRMCKIIRFACTPMTDALPFHFVWRLVTTVLHFETCL